MLLKLREFKRGTPFLIWNQIKITILKWVNSSIFKIEKK